MLGKYELISQIRTQRYVMNGNAGTGKKQCPVEVALGIIDGKWKLRILYFLQDGVLRYNEIFEKIPGISQKVLTSQLRQLERDGVLVRTAYPEIPPRVEYSLTPIGKKMITVYQALNTWALEYIDLELTGERFG